MNEIEALRKELASRNDTNAAPPSPSTGNPKRLCAAHIIDTVLALQDGLPPPFGEEVLAYCGANEYIRWHGFKTALLPRGERLAQEVLK